MHQFELSSDHSEAISKFVDLMNVEFKVPQLENFTMNVEGRLFITDDPVSALACIQAEANWQVGKNDEMYAALRELEGAMLGEAFRAARTEEMYL